MSSVVLNVSTLPAPVAAAELSEVTLPLDAIVMSNRPLESPTWTV